MWMALKLGFMTSFFFWGGGGGVSTWNDKLLLELLVFQWLFKSIQIFCFYCVTKTRSKPHFKIQSHSLPLLLNNNWSFVFYNFFTSNYLLPEVVCVCMGGSSLTPCVVQQLCRRGGINETFRGRHSRHPGIYRDATGLGTMCEQALILPIWKKAIRR